MTSELEIPKESVDAVLTALGREDYKWRTIAGIATETGLTQEIVARVINQTAERIVKSSVPSINGQDLFSTRDRFRKHGSVGEKLIGAFKNRAV